MLILQDQDSVDCIALMQKIIKLIDDNCQGLNYLVRIACKELENWYLGDSKAVEKVHAKSKASKFIEKAKFRFPDRLNGAEEMRHLSKDFGKVNSAREIAKIISIDENKSTSFNHFCSGLIKLAK